MKRRPRERPRERGGHEDLHRDGARVANDGTAHSSQPQLLCAHSRGPFGLARPPIRSRKVSLAE
jgi:hypothetical protein